MYAIYIHFKLYVINIVIHIIEISFSVIFLFQHKKIQKPK